MTTPTSSKKPFSFEEGLVQVPDEILEQILKYCCVQEYPIDTHLIERYGIHTQSFSPDLLCIDKRFNRIGLSVLYGVNDFYFKDLEQFGKFCVSIGINACANLRKIKLNFPNNDDIYSAQDFDACPNLKHVIFRLEDVSVVPSTVEKAVRARTSKFVPEVARKQFPFPPALAEHECVPSTASPLIRPNLPFLSECFLDLIRDPNRRFVAEATVEVERLNLSHTEEFWDQMRVDNYRIRPVPKGNHIKSSLLRRNYDLQFSFCDYLHDPEIHGY